VFDRLTARLERLLRGATRPDSRADAAALRAALVEAKAGVRALQAALADTERELTDERQQLADTERRGRLAAEVADAETVAVAGRFAARHRDRVTLLERKVAVQREEVAVAQREVEELAARYRAPASPESSSTIEAAWRELQATGATRPEQDRDLDTEAESLAAQADQTLRDRVVDAQLAYLKRKMGKNPSTPP